MHRLIIFILLNFCVILEINGQKILLIDDNDFISYNSDTIIKDLTAISPDLTVYNIETSGGIIPNETYFDEYDLVIWYCSTDGVDLSFWENKLLLKQLINEGKAIWIIGQDILFDAYGTPTKNFFAGDFEYDQMGIVKYVNQSYGNDGNYGCPEMNKTTELNSFPPTLRWIYPTLWWADGVNIRLSSEPYYIMGPSSYELAGSISMLYFSDGNKKVMTTLFDPSLIDPNITRMQFLKAGIEHMKLVSSSEDDVSKDIKIYPIPAKDELNISTSQKIETMTIKDLNGRLIESIDFLGENKIDISKIKNGIYLLTLTNKKFSYSTKFIKI
jgi:hypothetical protein